MVILKKVGPYFIALIIIVTIVLFLRNKNNSYEIESNNIRESVKVPTISKEMKKINENNNGIGSKWESKDSKKGLIHLWKIISPNPVNNKLEEEFDMFRFYETPQKYWQLNLRSKIIGDTNSIRTGVASLYENGLINEVQLNEKGLDSLFHSWGLFTLVK